MLGLYVSQVTRWYRYNRGTAPYFIQKLLSKTHVRFFDYRHSLGSKRTLFDGIMLKKDFYRRDPKRVARELLGKEIVRNGLRGIIVETEAYYGENDPASHACNGITERNKPMFGEPGRTYVYLCYGVYNLLNFTVRKKGKPGAVLIRALEPLEGIEKMQENRGDVDKKNIASGPGKLTQALEITTNDSNLDVSTDEHGIYVEEGRKCKNVAKSKRIGVSETHSQNLRFFCKKSNFISG